MHYAGLLTPGALAGVVVPAIVLVLVIGATIIFVVGVVWKIRKERTTFVNFDAQSTASK